MELTNSPLNAYVNLTALTSNGPARIGLPSPFEGSFALSSSTLFRPTVEQGAALDPSGHHRPRRISAEPVSRSAVKGNVAWAPGGDRPGFVEAKTTNAALQLVLS